ncbi:hypothetical protein COB72_02270 [bacterium]|nr:MAG: hypothetical protein COB72_02270 [bacterium]
MNQYQPQRKLPTNFIAIAASVLIAGSGYMLFSVRYGEPIRKGNRTASQMKSLERDLPGMVKESVDSAYEKTTAGVSGELGARLAESEASRDSLTRRVVQLEQEIANLRVSLQQLAAGTPIANSIQPAASNAAIPSTQSGTPGSTIPSVSPVVNPPAAFPQIGINSPLSSVQMGDIRIDILSAKVAGKQTMIEMLVTKTTAGEGYFSITNSIQSIRRMVTADGLEFDSLFVGRPGGSNSSSIKVELISGTAMRLVLYYKGQMPAAPFLARRIEFTAYEDRPRKIPLQFQFDNIAVTK